MQRLKPYKKWAAQVAATPRPTADPLAPPKKSKDGKGGKGKGGGGDGSDQMALVAAIRNKVGGRLLLSDATASAWCWWRFAHTHVSM